MTDVTCIAIQNLRAGEFVRLSEGAVRPNAMLARPDSVHNYVDGQVLQDKRTGENVKVRVFGVPEYITKKLINRTRLSRDECEIVGRAVGESWEQIEQWQEGRNTGRSCSVSLEPPRGSEEALPQ